MILIFRAKDRVKLSEVWEYLKSKLWGCFK
jgi:hypothetical protein